MTYNSCKNMNELQKHAERNLKQEYIKSAKK